MKKIILLMLPLAFLVLSCTKEETVRPPIDQTEWLGKERGVVVASNVNCNYFVVETAKGYNILRNWGGFSPAAGSVLYGNLGQWGVHTFYNRSEGYLMDADVRDTWLPYLQAMDQARWYCDPWGN